MENKEIDCPNCNGTGRVWSDKYCVDYPCDPCNSTGRITAQPTPAVDELNLEEDNEDISHLAGLPLSEIYLHGVIAGKDKRIKQLKKDLANNHASFVALVEGEIEWQKELSAENLGIEHDYCAKKLTNLLNKIK